MIDELFLKRMQLRGDLASSLKANSDFLMNYNFDHDVNYTKCALYDWNLKFLEEVEIKFQYSQKQSINRDQVENLVQFRPLYHPEQIYTMDDNKERLGFYLDVPDDTGKIYKWLLLARNEENQFVRYNALKCNWVFKYIVDGVLYEQLGVLRDRNNYNSGVWSDGFVTSVENQTQFLVPTNLKTNLIDYDLRFMLSDNKIHPLVYSVTKRVDTFPLGVTKIVLKQAHYNNEVDNAELGICDYYSSIIPPTPEQTDIINDSVDYSDVKIKYVGSKPMLAIGGSFREFSVYSDTLSSDSITGTWKYYYDNDEISQVNDYFVIEEERGLVRIRANKIYTIAGKILTLEYDVGMKHNPKIEIEVKAT